MDVSTCPARAAGQGVLFLGSCLAGLFRDCRSKQGACCHWIEIQRIVRFKSSHDLDRSTCCWGVSLRLVVVVAWFNCSAQRPAHPQGVARAHLLPGNTGTPAPSKPRACPRARVQSQLPPGTRVLQGRALLVVQLVSTYS